MFGNLMRVALWAHDGVYGNDGKMRPKSKKAKRKKARKQAKKSRRRNR